MAVAQDVVDLVATLVAIPVVAILVATLVAILVVVTRVATLQGVAEVPQLSL